MSLGAHKHRALKQLFHLKVTLQADHTVMQVRMGVVAHKYVHTHRHHTYAHSTNKEMQKMKPYCRHGSSCHTHHQLLVKTPEKVGFGGVTHPWVTWVQGTFKSVHAAILQGLHSYYFTAGRPQEERNGCKHARFIRRGHTVIYETKGK